MKLLRSARLLLNTWIARWDTLANSVLVRYRQRTCPHLFRAALIDKKPGRICKICDLAQPLSREQFYAEFGERYQAMLHGQ